MARPHAHPAPRFRRPRLLVAAALTTVLVASGCGLLDGKSNTENNNAGSTGSSGANKPEKSKITIGLLPVTDNAPVKVGINQGFFKQEGLEVEIKPFKAGPAAVPPLISGELDFSLINYVNYFSATEKKTLDAKIVVDGTTATANSMVLAAKPEAGIKEPKDLIGKKVSVHALGNINELLVKALLAANNLDPKGPSYQPVTFDQIGANLANGNLSAGVLVEPYITQAAQTHGAVPLFPIITGPTLDIPIAGYISMSKFAKENPKTVAAFQRAMVKAQKASADRKLLADVLPELTGVDKAAVNQLQLSNFPTTVDANRLQRVINLMKTHEFLKTDLNAKDLVVATPTS